MKTIQKITKTIAGVSAGISLAVLILMAALWIKGALHPEETPAVFGLVPLIVHTDSMAPVFQSGDLIFSVREDPKKILEGDVISFRDPASQSGSVVTHRVAEVVPQEDGSLAFRTRGDANSAADRELVSESLIAGVYRGVCLRGFGKVLTFLRSGPGLFVCFLAPLILFLVPEALFEAFEKHGESPSGVAAAGGESRRSSPAR